METILVVASALVIGTVVFVAGTVVALRATLRRQLRVAAGRRSAAPTTWVLPVGSAARLHLRLRSATARARLESARPECGGAGLTDVVGQLEGYAVEVEHALVSAARTPRTTRRTLLVPIAAQVTAVEQRAQRVATVAHEWMLAVHRDQHGPHAGSHPLQQIDDRLAATEHGARLVGSAPGTPGATSPAPTPRSEPADQSVTQQVRVPDAQPTPSPAAPTH